MAMLFLSAYVLRINMGKYRLQCEILSPVHIGAGDEIDPLDYIIDGGRLYRIAFEKFVMAMTDVERSRFEALLNKGDLIGVREYIVAHVDKVRSSRYSIEVSKQVENLYKSKLGHPQNQLRICPFTRSPGEYKAFIPGSSIKGAIRTAIVSEIAKTSRLPKPRSPEEEREFESKVLGYKDAKSDPFRAVKVGDESLKKEDLTVREVKNVLKKKEGGLASNEIQLMFEVSHSSITGKEVRFDTAISIDEGLLNTKFLGRAIGFEEIARSCKDFYTEKMENEHKKFYKGSEVEPFSNHLLNTPTDKGSFIIRLGRFCGVESVTLDDYRNPRPPGNKTVWGTSRNLAEGLYPMGWVKVTA
jgi:CRISPR-associated protein Csm5